MSEPQFTIWVFIDIYDDPVMYKLSPDQYVSELRSEILKIYNYEGYTIELWKLASPTKLHPSDNCKERVLASKKTKLDTADTISTVLSSINDAFQVLAVWRPPPVKRSLLERDERYSKRFHSGLGRACTR
ncbi:hypothetical protein BT96DRAFT_356608 [Gymnopus androsaceus JB14]|uniref:Uncharacterized protein n=1 Tax=Gymnopus androsaceus JB14 TaxID=1447944 RepID=A0A6A4I597_9AGAR|nr:hypothetical protein BT96DRAFT_356608 [Gymnopus androsaceus JB14]